LVEYRYKALVPNTIDVKKIQSFGPRYYLPKQKYDTILRTKTFGSRARLQNGKVLGTHSARAKPGLLDPK